MITFEVIQVRLKFISSNMYKISDKVMTNLTSMFSKYDLITKNDILIYSSDFHIRFKKKKKMFDEFLVRFITVIASLILLEIQKISII